MCFHRNDWSHTMTISCAALGGTLQNKDPWTMLKKLSAAAREGSNLWIVLLLRSGRFAGAVFEGQSVVTHKVFTRYTIRAKRGGGQSNYDSGGRKPKSAGAMLRRYGEQALKDDIHAQLRVWRKFLEASEVILVSVPKRMRQVLFEDSKDAPLMREDTRLRSIPFVTGRPSFKEAKEAFTRVTELQFLPFIADETADEGSKERTLGPVAVKKANVIAGAGAGGDVAVAATTPAPDVEETPVLGASCELVRELADALRRNECGQAGGVALIQAILDRYEEELPMGEAISQHTDVDTLATPLHIAAERAHPGVVGLILAYCASPLKLDVRGRTPFQVAHSKEVREAFRDERGRNPERWDWDACGVPPPASAEDLARRKEKEREKKRRAKERKKEEKRKEKEEERKAQDDQKKSHEAKVVAAGGCCGCSASLFGLTPFRRLEFEYCSHSTECVKLHQRRLRAEAAEKRFQT
ncbi:unnamed protein product [Chrysoparadoxa australica]